MPERHLYEYAVVRVVPQVEREEFLNVGVIVYCRRPSFLQARFADKTTALSACFPGLDTDLLQQYLRAFAEVADGTAADSPIAALDPAARFRWLTATRSSVLQCSKVHPGLCTDPERVCETLLQELVC